jgi:DNA repair exonuclease SbcCD ATPase subunit
LLYLTAFGENSVSHRTNKTIQSNSKEKQIEELEMKLMLERNSKKDLLTEKNNLEKVIEELRSEHRNTISCLKSIKDDFLKSKQKWNTEKERLELKVEEIMRQQREQEEEMAALHTTTVSSFTQLQRKSKENPESSKFSNNNFEINLYDILL